ncbi:MAG: hemerythrin domain-containing protein [Flavisolibacter sp.]|nr:hemerythrin domain-containing protein [Flavisolibacter sp.]MBD0366270.1 hemerythrin domain-containing protein [Flavisolibacter sp.]
MADAIKPIKRSMQLTPLSREHHEGLLFVWKIRQGIRYKIEPNRISHFCTWFWQHHLISHFQKEEEVLPRLLTSDHPMVQQMMREHQQIKHQLETLQQGADYNNLEHLAQLLYDHIRFEERQLFNEVEKRVAPELLEKIAAGLEGEKNNAAWDDTFWLK